MNTFLPNKQNEKLLNIHAPDIISASVSKRFVLFDSLFLCKQIHAYDECVRTDVTLL